VMDWQSAFNFIFTAFVGVCGYVLKSVHDAVQRLTEDLHKLEKEIPANYPTKSDINIVFHDIKNTLIRIESKMDGKQDK
jgi:hypothetical protein